MLEIFYPNEYVDSSYVINYEDLYRNGYRGILFDVDNTLVPHGAKADKRAKELFERLKKQAFPFALFLIIRNIELRALMMR